MNSPDERSDAQLVTDFRAGDRDAFLAIYDRYADRVYSYCMIMLGDPGDAEEVTHDTFARAGAEISGIGQVDMVRPWLFGIARIEARRVGLTAGAGLITLDERSDPGDFDFATPTAEEVWRAGGGLAERDRQLFALNLVEGLSGEHLAVAMGVSESRLDVMLTRMRDRVRRLIGTGADLEGTLVGRAPAALRPRVLGSIAVPVTEVVVNPAHDRSPLFKTAVLGLVAVVFGVIGLMVSAQFDPGETTIPVVAESTTTVPRPGTAIGSTTTTTRRQDPTSTTSGSVPARITVSAETVDFGEEDVTAELRLGNEGGQTGEWSITASSPAITVTRSEGSLDPGATVDLKVALDRTQIAEGDLRETLTVTWANEEITIDVVGSFEDNPVIHNPVAQPAAVEVDAGSNCLPTQTNVSARIRDTSALASVIVRWSPGGSATTDTPMNDVGGDIFEAVVGPFRQVGEASVRIVATDERGNAGGASIIVTVGPCN